MAIITHDLTVKAPDLLGAAYDPRLSPVVFFLDTNLGDGEALIDTVNGAIRLGSARLKADAAGTAVFTDVIGTDSDNADLNLDVDAVLQYRVRAEYTDAVTRRTAPLWTSGWFELNDDANLATDITFSQYAPVSWQTAFIEQAEAYLEQQESLAGITVSDELIAYLLANPSAARDSADERFDRKSAVDIRDFGVVPAHPVDDGTDLAVPDLDDWTTELAQAQAEAQAEKRGLYMPTGVYGATALTVLTGVPTWGDGVRGLFERTGSTVLKQLGTDVGDFVRFESFELTLFPGVFFLGFGSSLRHMTIVGPQAGTIGNGISFTTADGDPCTGVTGDVLKDIAVTGFAESGIYCPDGTGPGHWQDVIAYANRLYGLDYQIIDPNHNIALHLDNFQGDANGLALVRLKGLSSRASVVITNLKSEKLRNKWYGVAPVADNPVQDHALIIEDCDQTKIVVDGISHYSSHSTKGPESAIHIIGPDQPRLVWRGVETRLLSSQTASGVDTSVTNAVTGVSATKAYGTEGSTGTNLFRHVTGKARLIPNAAGDPLFEVWDRGYFGWLDSGGTLRKVLQLDTSDNVIKLGSLSETATIPMHFHASGSTDCKFFTGGVERFRVNATEVRAYRDFAIDDGKNLKLGSTTGTQIGTTTSEKLAFHGATPVVRPAAFTQTYSTATRTHSNPTAAAVATTAATQTTPYGFTTQAQADAMVTAINALVADLANTKQVLNQVLDDLQTLGLLG